MYVHMFLQTEWTGLEWSARYNVQNEIHFVLLHTVHVTVSFIYHWVDAQTRHTLSHTKMPKPTFRMNTSPDFSLLK